MARNGGYAHPDYAYALREYGEPRALPASGASVLVRSLRDLSLRDSIACYPLLCCPDWSGLRGDLDALGGELVALSAVIDPFHECSLTELRACFPEVLLPFKEHYVIDLAKPVDSRISSHHRRNTRRALRAVEVIHCPVPARHLHEWERLYSNLIRRHGIAGLQAFSSASFAAQLRVPGIVAFRAVRDRATVGMVLWYRSGRDAYYHLGAYSDVGYEHRASYALFRESLAYLASDDVDRVNLGGGAGLRRDGSDGLSRFKRGWSTGTQTAHYGVRVYDGSAFARFCNAPECYKNDGFRRFLVETVQRQTAVKQ